LPTCVPIAQLAGSTGVWPLNTGAFALPPAKALAETVMLVELVKPTLLVLAPAGAMIWT
jgi:hypothetical protein